MQGNRLEWFKSSYSAQNGDCVEVRSRYGVGGVGLRDSKALYGPVLEFTGAEWGKFIRGIQDNEFKFSE